MALLGQGWFDVVLTGQLARLTCLQMERAAGHEIADRFAVAARRAVLLP